MSHLRKILAVGGSAQQERVNTKANSKQSCGDASGEPPGQSYTGYRGNIGIMERKKETTGILGIV